MAKHVLLALPVNTPRYGSDIALAALTTSGNRGLWSTQAESSVVYFRCKALLLLMPCCPLVLLNKSLLITRALFCSVLPANERIDPDPIFNILLLQAMLKLQIISAYKNCGKKYTSIKAWLWHFGIDV